MNETKSKLNGIPKRMAAIAIAAALAVTMCPAPALALTATQAGTVAGALESAEQAASTQAAKETVYVVSGIKAKLPNYGFIVKNGQLRPIVTSKSVQLSYNKNGLLSKERKIYSWRGSKAKRTTRYSYNGKANLTSSKATDTDGYVERIEYALGKGGKFKKSTYRQTRHGKLSAKYVTKYTYDNGRIARVSSSRNGSEQAADRVFTYDQSGRIASYTSRYNSTFHPKFDSHGNVKSDYLTYNYGGNGGTYTHKNVYDKKGRLVKKAVYGMKYKYAYKSIRVDSEMADKVKAQQWALLNDNLNVALGFTNMASYFGDIR